MAENLSEEEKDLYNKEYDSGKNDFSILGYGDTDEYSNKYLRSEESLNRARKFTWTEEEYREVMKPIYEKIKEAYKKAGKDVLGKKSTDNIISEIFSGKGYEEAKKLMEEAKKKYPWLFPDVYGYKLDIPDEYLPTDEWMDEIEEKRKSSKNDKKEGPQVE